MKIYCVELGRKLPVHGIAERFSCRRSSTRSASARSSRGSAGRSRATSGPRQSSRRCTASRPGGALKGGWLSWFPDGISLDKGAKVRIPSGKTWKNHPENPNEKAAFSFFIFVFEFSPSSDFFEASTRKRIANVWRLP